MTEKQPPRGPRTEPPAINQTERDSSDPLGPEDSDAGPEGPHPDPDDYAGADDH